MPWQLVPEKPMNVVVVGGSLSGLIYGLMIKRLGHNVHILERTTTDTRASQAAGMGAGPWGTEYMKIYDRYVEPYSFLCAGSQTLDRAGHVKRTSKWPLNLTGWDVLYFRLRANFDGLKSEYCPEPPKPLNSEGKAFYDLGKRATSTVYSDGLVTVQFDDIIQGGCASIDAHLVVIADGSTSMIRAELISNLRPSYSGYVAWRGTVPEREVTESTRQMFDTRFNLFVMKKSHVVGYAMPGENGNLSRGQRVFNYVWYNNCPEGSSEYVENMTDTDGHFHINTLPIGKMRPETWANLKSKARKVQNPPFLELIEKTAKPFISTVRDCSSPRATFYDGKLLLVGEALTLYRPHSGISFNQSALNCLKLQKVLQGEKSLKAWEDEALKTQEIARTKSMVLGEYYQSGVLSYNFLSSALQFVVAMVLSRWAKFWDLA
ncbi:hypothetical protein MMC12_007567 [Toensbergia leucococca]|nr:hypothetical protein [Toensbergia leucococca]